MQLPGPVVRWPHRPGLRAVSSGCGVNAHKVFSQMVFLRAKACGVAAAVS